MPKKIEVVDPENEVPQEVLAKAIVQASEAAQKLLAGPLTRRAIVVLIQDACPANIPRTTIELVLNAAADLRRRYVK